MTSHTEYLLQLHSGNTNIWLTYLTLKSKTKAINITNKRRKEWPFFKLRLVRRVTVERVLA